MYNTHPKLYYKILGKKVRIILEILRYVQKYINTPYERNMSDMS